MAQTTRQRSGQTANAAHQEQNRYNPTLHELIHDVCNQNDIGPLPDLPVLGHIRCPGIGKPPSNRACWINIKTGVAHIVDHASGFTTSVFEGRVLTSVDRAEFQRKQIAAARIEKAKKQASIEGASRAWISAEPCAATKYTDTKNVSTHDCRWHPAQDCLLVPLRTAEGDLQSLQRIYDDGKKLCWPGAPTKAAFFLIGQIEFEILVCEGMATGSSLHKHTGKPVACAMFAGNLLAVCEALRNRYPSLTITVCGDDDRTTDGNPGRTKAIEAANAVDGKLAMPTLCEGCSCSDFNDQANCPQGGSQ